MRIAISNIADKFKLKFKRLLYALGPEVREPGLHFGTLRIKKPLNLSARGLNHKD